MQTVSSTYTSILANGGWHECKLEINGTAYDMEKIVSMRTSAALWDGAASVGNTIAGTIDVSLVASSNSVPTMAELRPYVRAIKKPHYGRNLLIENRIYPFVPAASGLQGITLTKGADGAIVINGTKTNAAGILIPNFGDPNATSTDNQFDYTKWLATGSYKMSVVGENVPSGMDIRLQVYRYTSTAATPSITSVAYASANGAEVSFNITDAYTFVYCRLYIGTGTPTFSNCKIYPMIKAATDTSTGWEEPAQSITMTSEWLPKGVYFIDTREYDKETGVLYLTGMDAMLKGEQDYMTSGAQGTWPAVDINILCDIADRLELGDDQFTAVSSPSGNPKNQGWYYKSGNNYYLTSNTSVVSGTTYYKRSNTGIDSRTLPLINKYYKVQYPGYGEDAYTVREVLGYIGAFYAGNWVINDSGQLRLLVLGDIPAETYYLITEDGDRITLGGDRLVMV